MYPNISKLINSVTCPGYTHVTRYCHFLTSELIKIAFLFENFLVAITITGSGVLRVYGSSSTKLKRLKREVLLSMRS